MDTVYGFVEIRESGNVTHSDDIIPTLTIQKIIEMLSVMDLVFLCGLLLLPAACGYQLVRGRAEITGTFQMFVFPTHFSEGNSMFQREAVDFCFPNPARPSTALGRT